jgi:hypothetical protein
MPGEKLRAAKPFYEPCREPVALGGATLAFIGKFWFRVNGLPVCASNTRQDLIHRVLDARVRTMKPACRLGSKLAEHIPVLHGV